MTNFSYLSHIPDYKLFASAAVEAEKVYHSAPAMCAVGCRKALELGVKWVYSADSTMDLPYRDNLQSLLHEPCFRDAMDSALWQKLRYIVKLGNHAVHTGAVVKKDEALYALKSLFEFVQWIAYCYGEEYTERRFDAALIPTEKLEVDAQKIREQESLLGEKDAVIESLRTQVAELSARFTAQKEHREERSLIVADLSEFQTRKRFIDVDLRALGWRFDGPAADVQEEYEVGDMNGVLGQKGYVDYVLFGRDGLPLAVLEAKRTSKDPNVGRKQAMLYADALERRFGRRPMLFTSNGFETYFWDDQTGPQRRVSGFFSKDDLQRLMNRRTERRPLDEVEIDDKITDRYYQKAAIRAICGHMERGERKHLLVMATGTGKTRTASSLTDVLSRGGWVTNILFLADRTALVKQARDDFKKYLPDMSLCNLCSNKDDRSARIVFSTYPTMLNAIDSVKTREGLPLFTPAHFDLIIIDESHRSIFKKYKDIFEYFDAVLVGLTATPKTDVDRNTYDFFEIEHNVPTYSYDYETAVHNDHVLVPYYNYEVKTKFLEEGITYDQLSEEDKQRYEEDFAEDDTLPDFIPSAALNKFVFNEKTVDLVLEDLMERGIRVAGGDRLGKTILFAQNRTHAEFILQRFNKLYPHYKGTFAQRVLCVDSYAQAVIDDFKRPEKEPHIAVSVDMMDTGIDVPECVNLVFFKKVRSKTKFWQMIGRGTRLCPELSCIDPIDGEYTDKRRFLIFDYCGNFEFFRTHKEGYESRETASLTERIFCKQIRLAAALQEAQFAGDGYQALRKGLVDTCHAQVKALNPELTSVRLKRRYVEKYSEAEAFVSINEEDKRELTEYLAPLVRLDDKDEAAKRFDNFMYGMMLAQLEQMPAFQRAKRQLCDTAVLLEKKASIPQVQAKLTLIREVQTDEFWAAEDLLLLEKVRVELRDLIQFLMGDGPSKPLIVTKLSDPILDEQEGKALSAAYDFEDYRRKVNRYIEEHGDVLAIHKLTHNIPLSAGDYSELERILTSELGSREDYVREFGSTPFGLLVRRIAKMDHQAAMEAFSRFINDESLNERQIAFVKKVIHHIEQNGYMESVGELLKPPFDKPMSFVKMFDQRRRTELTAAIQAVRDNATNVMEA